MNYKDLKEKLKKCRNMSFDDVDIDTIDDINKIKIDKRKSSNERILDFLNSVNNPYIFKVNGRLVKLIYSDVDKTADDSLTNVLKSLYK